MSDSSLPLPAEPCEITSDWLNTLFHENTVMTEGSVLAVSTQVIGQEQGFTGLIARVSISYTDDAPPSLPSSVVVKFPMATRDKPSAYRIAQQQDKTAQQRYFERCAREVAFYKEVAPFSTLPVPHLYYGAVDSTTSTIVLVLEDLHSAHSGDSLHGCSIQEATLVIDQLAAFHARWWNSPTLTTFPWLPAWGGDAQREQERYCQSVQPFLQRFDTQIPVTILNMIDALKTDYGTIRIRLKQQPTTVIHGDLHLDNILFHSEPPQPGVTLLDWQSVAQGRCAIDVALFLIDSLNTPTRRADEMDLLHRYHAQLVAAGIHEYSFEQLIEDCQLALLWLLGAQVIWLGSLADSAVQGREQALINASLADFTALLDYKVGSLLPL